MPGGRPPRTSSRDKAADTLVRKVVDELAFSARRDGRQGRNATTSSRHLLLAVTAARIAAAADRLAHTHVALARDKEGVTWEQVGEAFGTTRQSAHERFRIGTSP
ncbi:MAG: hypothetical protein AB1679_12850 [Actinomycetota bacterium]|jgi:hypothetical protein